MNQNTEGAGVPTGYDELSEVQAANGAKTGAVRTPGQDSDAQLTWLSDVWSSLPDDARAQILEIARVNALSPSTVDAET